MRKSAVMFIYAVSLLFCSEHPAAADTYRLEIDYLDVNITGDSVRKIAVNGSIPGPVLRFAEGEEVVINVTNHLDEVSSIHWHGLLLPGEMDGVPGANGFYGIKPGATFTYRFRIRQSGTYWYHAHSLAQEQEGIYGAIVIAPRNPEPVHAEQDYILLLSDFTEEKGLTVLGNLKMDSGYYNFHKRTVGDFLNEAGRIGFLAAWRDALSWGEMRMSPTDISDVSGYTFLMNGKTREKNWTGTFASGDRVRLRFINASAMTMFDVRIPGLKMTVVQADGQNVEPVEVDEFRFGIAETYDVIVEPPESRAYTIAAESIDRTGFALGTLAPEEGMRGDVPKSRPRALLTMADMGASHGSQMDHSMHEGMQHGAGHMSSGWADAGTPPGHKALDYSDLRSLGAQPDTKAPEREILVRLGGNMERFIWTMNGKKFEQSSPISLKYGERVRLTFVNETMMAHPMHLHGMFMQLENGRSSDKLPNKHTIIIPPGLSRSVLLTADEPGEWAFHCHLLYHMLGGMMTTVVVSDPKQESFHAD